MGWICCSDFYNAGAFNYANFKAFLMKIINVNILQMFNEAPGLSIIKNQPAMPLPRRAMHQAGKIKWGKQYLFFPCSATGRILACLMLMLSFMAASAQHTAGLRAGKTKYRIFARALRPEEMREDLTVFKKIREEANSGMYRYVTKTELEKQYHNAFEKIKRPLSVQEFYRLLVGLTDSEGSIHNKTELSEEDLKHLNEKTTFFPYHLKYLQGKIYFDAVKKEIPLGSRILSINQTCDSLLIARFSKYITTDGFNTSAKASNSINNAFGNRYPIEFGLTGKFKVDYTEPDSHSAHSVVISGVDLNERNKNVAGRHSAGIDSLTDWRVQKSHSFEILDDQTARLNFRIFNMADGTEDPAFAGYVTWVDSVFRVLENKKIKNLILDIRGNPGGSDPTYEQPMMYLTGSRFRENSEAFLIFDELPNIEYFWGKSTASAMDEGAKRAYLVDLKGYFTRLENGYNFQAQGKNPYYLPKSPAFGGNLYLLIDENVASAASHLASLVRAYARNLTVVGTETGGGYYGHNGHFSLVYELPNSKIKTRFSAVYVVQDAPAKIAQTLGHGTMPDYEVSQTFEDFMEKKDTQLNFVMKLIQSRIKQ